MSETYTFQWWAKGDLDGFFGLFVDNLIQLILIVALCSGFLGMPGEMVFGRILPAVAVSLLLGNLFYAWQAKALSLKTGKKVTALPYGVNTVSLFAYIFFVMKPVLDRTGDIEVAWLAGLAACLGSGVIELGGSWIAGWVKKITPRAALLTTLAGIAITFISMDFFFRTFEHPLVAFAPMAFIFIQYIGRMALPTGIPAGFLAIITGTLLAWGLGVMDYGALVKSAHLSLQLPSLYLPELFQGFFSEYIIEFLPVIVPMGLFNLLGSLQNLESAEAAGDAYPVAPSLAINGAGTIVAALMGSVFPTTIYIGHPAWKSMGAGAGYSIANGVVVAFLCFFGLVGFVSALVPIEAGAAILLWIGITIAAQAFQSTPREHSIAVVVGLFPALAAWGLMLIQGALSAAGATVGGVGIEHLGIFVNGISGLISLERGFIFTSMILAAMTVAVVERQFITATGWAVVAALLAATGLIHGYQIEGGAIVNAYGPVHTWPFVAGYSAIALIFYLYGFLEKKRRRV